MSKKLIKVDLSIFFDDERKMVFILIDPSWKYVECLQKRVELLFDVDAVRFLTDGCFLPSQESIEILQFFNNIKAFVPRETLEIRKLRKSKENKNIEKSAEHSKEEESFIADCENQKTVKLKKKRKSTCLQTAQSSSSLKRSKKSHTNYLLDNKNAKEEAWSQSLEKIYDEGESTKSTAKSPTEIEIGNQSNGSRNQTKVKNSVEKSFVSGKVNDKHKQSHTLISQKDTNSKSLEKDLMETFNDELQTLAVRQSNIPSSTLLSEPIIDKNDNISHSSTPLNPNNPFKKPKFNSSHIHFNETGEIVNTNIKKRPKSTPKKDKALKAIITFRCPLSNVTNDIEPHKPRVFHLESKNSSTKKSIVEIQEEIILPPHSIQKRRTDLCLSNEESATTDVDKKKENNETIKMTNSIIEKSSFNNTIDTTTTKTGKNDHGEKLLVRAGDLKVSQNEEVNVNETQSQCQMESTTPTNGDASKTQSESEMHLTSRMDEDVVETQNESQVELSNIEEGISRNQNESQVDQWNINENATATQNESQVEPTITDGDVTEITNASLTQTTYVDEIDDKLDNKNKTEQGNGVTSIDCVDLSHDANESSKSEEIVTEKHDLTADDESGESDVEEISEIIDLNESQDNCNTNVSALYKNSFTQIRIKDILPFAIDLKIFPNVEDIVIFKIPYTRKDKTIANTDFMAGKVEYINKRTKNIKILVEDGLSELCNVPSKLMFCNMDDSQDYVKYLQLKLTDMREAKLFSRS